MLPEDIGFVLPENVCQDEFAFLEKSWDVLREEFVFRYPDMLLQMRWLKGLTTETGFGNIAQHDVAAALVAASLHYITSCQDMSEVDLVRSMLDHNNIKAFRKMSEADWRSHLHRIDALNDRDEIIERIIEGLGTKEDNSDHIFRRGSLSEILNHIKSKLESLPDEMRSDEYRLLVSLTDYKPDEQVLLATEIAYHYPENFDLENLIMVIAYFADDSAEHNNVVEATRRVEEVAGRMSQLDDDISLTRQLGGHKYWDVERQHVLEARRVIIEKAEENGFSVENEELLVFYAMQEYANHLLGHLPD